MPPAQRASAQRAPAPRTLAQHVPVSAVASWSAAVRQWGQRVLPGSGSTPKRSRRKRQGANTGIVVAVLAVLGVVVLAWIFFSNNSGSTGQAGAYPYTIGSPGPGEMAPPIKLASTTGVTFDLSSMRGKNVLLYYQEGLTCQPCWDQLKDVQAQRSQFSALGIDAIVSVTTDPLDALKQKVADEGLTLPVLSNPDLAVSKAYTANQYSMMGASRDGHTFILVGPNGRIRWRADYGAAPKYTMYVPVPNLIADLRAGLHGSSS